MKRVAIFAIYLLVSCSGRNKIPEGVMKPDKMTAVMLDVFRAEGLSMHYNRKAYDSLLNPEIAYVKYYTQVFSFHKITKDEFFTSYHYYLQHPDLFKTVLDSVNAINERTRYDVYQSRPDSTKK